MTKPRPEQTRRSLPDTPPANTAAVSSWVLYDLANTIFSMGVLSLFFSLWIRETVGAERADSTYGIITALSMSIIFVASPLLGAMTDRARRRIPFLMVSTLVCVLFTALLARGDLIWSAIFFIVANIAYQAGLQFYDALLPEVSNESNRGRIGGVGVSVGYLGSFIAVALGLIFGTEDKPFLFLLIAIGFLLFSIPCFLFVRERGNPNPSPVFSLSAIIESSRITIETLRSGREYPGLARFLIGRVFYTDAINTVIAIMALFTVNVAVSTGLTEREGERQANFILMSAICFAVLGGLVWGWQADRLGPRRTLRRVLGCWMLIFLGAASIGILRLPIWTMYLVAFGAGFSLGGIWAADRPFMLRLTPPWRVGEFYGLYGMVGRFSAVTGPATWALVTYLTIQIMGLDPPVGQGIGVLTLFIEIVLAYWILAPVSDLPRDWRLVPGSANSFISNSDRTPSGVTGS